MGDNEKNRKKGNKNSSKTNKITGVNKSFNYQHVIRPINFLKKQQYQSNIGNLNLTNSYSCEISNGKSDIYNERNPCFL